MEVGGLGINSAALTPVSGYINVGTPIATSAFVSTNYAVTTNQAINFDTVIFDTASGVIQTSGMILVGAANTWKFVAPVTGVYQVHCMVRVGAVALSIYLYQNGVKTKLLMNPPGQDQNYTGSTFIRLSAGDSLSVNSDTSATVNGAALNNGGSHVSIGLVR